MLQLSLLRLARAVLVVLVVTLMVSGLLSLAPGSQATVALGETATPEQIAALEEKLGLNRSFLEQWLHWVGSALHGDLGSSLVTGQDVGEAIWAGLPVTVEIAVLAQLIALLISVPLAIVAASRTGGAADRVTGALTSAFLAVPAFVAAPVLVYLLAVRQGWFPVTGWTPLSEGLLENLRSAFLPALAVSFIEVAAFQRILRTDLATTLREDYIAAARAKGLAGNYVLVRHALRPSSFSLLTVAGIGFGRLLSGTIIVESFFSLPGLGQLVARAVSGRDVVMIQGVVTFVAIAYVLLNTLVDLGYGALDPRIRLASSR